MEFILGVLTIVVAGLVYYVHQLVKNSKQTDALINNAFNQMRELDAERKRQSDATNKQNSETNKLIDEDIDSLYKDIDDINNYISELFEEIEKLENKITPVVAKKTRTTKKK